MNDLGSTSGNAGAGLYRPARASPRYARSPIPTPRSSRETTRTGPADIGRRLTARALAREHTARACALAQRHNCAMPPPSPTDYRKACPPDRPVRRRDPLHQLTPASVCADREAAADHLAERAEIRRHAEQALRARGLSCEFRRGAGRSAGAGFGAAVGNRLGFFVCASRASNSGRCRCRQLLRRPRQLFTSIRRCIAGDEQPHESRHSCRGCG